MDVRNALILTLLITATPNTVLHAAKGQVEVLWLGHATTRITSVNGKVILIDPFLKKNPKTPAKYKDLLAIGAVDAILVTHGHGDHVRDLQELAEMTGATVVAPYEFAWNAAALGITDASKTVGMNKGGTVTPVGRGIKIHMVPAEHSSSVDLLSLGLQESGTGQQRMLDAGPSVGYVVELENEFKIYHSGDTGVFGDMALIHELYAPDLALVCIGGHFTMDPEGAAYALRKLIKPEQVIPIHYGTVLDVKPGDALRF